MTKKTQTLKIFRVQERTFRHEDGNFEQYVPQELLSDGTWKDSNRGPNARILRTYQTAIDACRYNAHFFNINIYQVEGVDEKPWQVLPLGGFVRPLYLANQPVPIYFLPEFEKSTFGTDYGAIIMFNHRYLAERYLRDMIVEKQLYSYDDQVYSFPH